MGEVWATNSFTRKKFWYVVLINFFMMMIFRTHLKTTLGVLLLGSPNATHRGNPGGWGSPPRITYAFFPIIVGFEMSSRQ
jgi:uncharacterized membrane protein YhaH (DUF805 family)